LSIREESPTTKHFEEGHAIPYKVVVTPLFSALQVPVRPAALAEPAEAPRASVAVRIFKIVFMRPLKSLHTII